MSTGTERVAKLCIVSGRVQGVYYRASTQQIAQRLGLLGFARNLADGRVEVLAIGTRSGVDQLVEWLNQGPPAAKVVGVEIVDLTLDAAEALRLGTGFRTA